MSNEETQIPNESNLLESTVKLDEVSQPPTSAPQNPDDVPIGGKRFEFSEFPSEGDELPKPKKATKKPPARFANKMADSSEAPPPAEEPAPQEPIKTAGGIDDLPVGGKKFDFSEFPEQGEQPKKVAKKPPARFAKRMEEAEKLKQAKQEAPNGDEVSKPAVGLDDLPVGGGKKTQFSEFPEEGEVRKPPPKKVTPKPKPKPAATTPSVPPADLDEVPIGGGSKMPGQFDEVPIGKSNTFAMSEFPQGDQQTPVETNYTMSQKLKSKAIKMRLSGMEDLLALLQEDPNSPDMSEVEIGKLLKETNPACLEKILQCLKVWIEKDKKWGDDQAKSAIENGYINGKPNTKKLTVEITDLMYEKAPDAVEMTIMVGLKGKVPKTLAGYIAMLNEMLAIYGIKRMKFMKPYMGDLVTILNREKLVAVKTEGMTLLKECYKWLTKDVVDPLLKDLKQNLKKQLDTFWEGYDKDAVMAAPKDIPEANDGKPKKKIDAYELSEAVDVFKKYNEKFAEQVIKEEKWSEKVKLMQEFVNAANVPKLAHTDYRHISQMTRRLINHSNFNVVLWDLKILAVLSKGLRRHFFQTVKSQFSNVIGKFRDKKTLMVEETFNTLNDFSYCISLEDVIDDVKEGLGDKAPNMKVNLINWIGKFVEKKIEEKDQLSDKAAEALQALFPTFQKLLADGVADVRDAMVKNIGKMKILVGEDFFAAMDKKMTKGQASKAEQAKKEVPKKLSREKEKKGTPMKAPEGGKGKGKEKTMENSSILGNQGSSSINDDIQDLIPKMNHSDWQKRKESAEAIIEILSNNSEQKINLPCLHDLLSTLKVRVADPNKNIVKYFVQLTALVFEIMPERDVKSQAKNFMGALADGLSDKMQSNRVEIAAALNKLGDIYGKEHLLTLLGSYLDNDKDSRVDVINLILENEEYMQKADTREYPKGIIRGLTDRNKQIRSLSERLLEKVQQKMGMQVFKNLAKNERPAISKDLNLIFSKFENSNKSTISKANSPPKMKQPPISAKKVQSQRSVSKNSRTHTSFEKEESSEPMYATMQANSSFLKGGRSFVEDNEEFAPLKVLASERVQRQQNDERCPWIGDNIKDSQEEELIEAINCLFKPDTARKMVSMDHRKVNEACQHIMRLCKDIAHQNQIREVYDLILKWSFIRLWGGNPALQSIIEILPPIMSILEKKRLALSDGEVDVVVAILREYFITGYMNEFKVSESLYTITRCLIALSSGDRLLRKLLMQFGLELTSLHRHIRKQATAFYRDGLSKLIKHQLMEYVGNGSTLEEASHIKELKNDPEFVDLLYRRFHENVLDSFGFRSALNVQQSQPQPQTHHHQPPIQQSLPPAPQPPKRNDESVQRETVHREPPQNERRTAASREDTRNGNHQHPPHRSHIQAPTYTHHVEPVVQAAAPSDQEMDLNLYQMPHPASPLGKHLAKLLPANESTVAFFNALLMESGQKISVELSTYAKIIFASILRSVEVVLAQRNQYSPEKVLNQINLLQQAIKCKHIINNIGELLYFGTRFALTQLVYEDENKGQILSELQQRGIDFKVEQFIKAINGVMLRILENACPQETVNILLRMLNFNANQPNISQKTVSLIIKCMSRVATSYSLDINEQRTQEFMSLTVEYFYIIKLQFHLQEFNPTPDEKLKPEETIIKTIKGIITELARHFGEEVWVHYDEAMNTCKFTDNHISKYLQFMGVAYPDNAAVYQPEDEELKKINELLSKTKSFDIGIVELKKYQSNNPDFNPAEYFTSRGYDQKFIMMVLTALETRKSKRTPTKRQLRDEKSQNSRKAPEQPTSESNIQDRIQRLKMKFDEIQPKPEEKPVIKSSINTSTRAKDEDRNEERAAEIKRRIDEMKNRLNR